MQLRPYQQDAIQAVYRHLQERDDNPVVVIPTAGGKTNIMATICRDAVTMWGGRVLVLAHVKELLEQTADKLKLVCPELPVGVYSAGLNRRDTSHRVIVAGIQSIHKRACELDAFDLIIIDEVHLVPSDGDGMYRQFLADAKVVNPHVRVIGLTATPYRLDSGPICSPEHFLNTICYEIGVKELIRDGYLCPLITKSGATKVDTSSLHIRGGEFVADEVESLMDDDAVVAAACQEIVEYTRDRQACLIFASSVNHGRHVVATLKSQHNLDCGFVCGDTPAGERAELLARFRGDKTSELFPRPPLKYLCNVNVLTTGFDAPNIDCVAMLRPTMSPGLYYQMCLDMETEVLTPSGWRRCHEVTTGDVVASFDLESEEIVYEPSLAKVHRALRKDESMYGVKAPHLDIRVTDQHMMVVRGRAKTCLHWQLQTAGDASRRKDSYLIPISGKGKQRKPEAQLTDAEIEFIGWFLTDGYLNHSNNSITISQSVAKFEADVRNVLLACGFSFCEYRIVRTGKQEKYVDGVMFCIPRYQGRGSNQGLRGWDHLKDWLDKDLPSIFNTLSKRQFAILLGAMDLGNGRNSARADYNSRVMSISVGCRKRMADRIQQLGIERGYRCNIATMNLKPSDWNRNPLTQWLVHIKPQCVAVIGGTTRYINKTVPRRCQLQAVEFEGNEWVWCLTTQKGTLVTRRNGKVAIVGNCGRGFRLHPSKQNCLVLDFGGNVLRHGPVDQLRVKDKNTKGSGEAPAKECPQCHSVVAAGYSACPDCGFVFPPPERQSHEGRATEAGILSGQVTSTSYRVTDVHYSVHIKRGASDDVPKSLRVDYQVGWHEYKSEWVCLEHDGYARQKAIAWWRRRSPDPVPDSAQRAVELAHAGALATTTGITVRTIAGEQFERITDYELGPLPEPVPDSEIAVFDDDSIPF